MNASYIEKQIIGALLDAILADSRVSGVNIYDGEETVLEQPTRDRGLIEGAIGTTDETTVLVYSREIGTGKQITIGHVFLVHGNDVDVISDYSTTIEDLVAPANAKADEIDGR